MVCCNSSSLSPLCCWGCDGGCNFGEPDADCTEGPNAPVFDLDFDCVIYLYQLLRDPGYTYLLISNAIMMMMMVVLITVTGITTASSIVVTPIKNSIIIYYNNVSIGANITHLLIELIPFHD